MTAVLQLVACNLLIHIIPNNVWDLFGTDLNLVSCLAINYFKLITEDSGSSSTS